MLRGLWIAFFGLLLASAPLAEAAPGTPPTGPRGVKKKKAVALPKAPPPVEVEAPPPPEPPPPPPPVATATVTPPAAAAPSDGTLEEEIVDFDKEEQSQAASDAKVLPGGGVSGLASAIGLKLFVDLLVDYTVGEKKFEFRPNHTYVFAQVSVYDDLGFIIHISDDPIFFELSWNITPKLTLTAGKLMVPFGTNQFHHIIGGRVDELSYFLPETWGDFGISVQHKVYDSEKFAAEYVAYAVNGFAGSDAPVIADGSLSDNNFWKALGGRLSLTFFQKIKLITSVYFDAWDVDNKNKLLFYAIGGELNPGLIDLPVLRHMRLRGEWARGEIQLPDRNYQQGILEYAFARSGYYAELTYFPFEIVAFRLRAGRINPDNTVTDANDVEIYEPAILVGVGKKVILTFAYQLTAKPGFDYSFKDPPDMAYAKFFLQY